MNDFIHQTNPDKKIVKTKGILEQQVANTEAAIKVPEVTEEMRLATSAYNQNVKTLDPRYASVKPVAQVLVRCHLIEPKVSEAGLITPFSTRLEVNTESGRGRFEDVELPYLLALTAQVVAVPANTTAVSVNDTVQLNERAVQGSVIGQGFDRKVVLRNAFIRTDLTTEIPKDVTNEHFGYILVSVSDIQAILPND